MDTDSVVLKNLQNFFQKYDILTGQGFKWVPSSHGQVPPEALPAGRTATGEELYIGRAFYMNSLTPGKIHRSHHCMYIPFAGNEISLHAYEVLVVPQRALWVRATPQNIPFNAVHGGHDSDSATIFVGRAYHAGDLIPAKVIPSKNVAFCSYNGMELQTQEFEVGIELIKDFCYAILVDSDKILITRVCLFQVLCGGRVQWVPSSFGHIPPNAVHAGHTSSGEPLFVGRAYWQGSLTVGKIHPSHQALYLPYGGVEVPVKSNYEVLIEV